MPNSWLLDTNYSGGLQETHYFDGRLLTADALKADQDAVQVRQNWLGRAAGYGVIEGLVVRKVQTSGAKLGVTKGLGVNYAGHIVRLAGDMSLELGKGTPEPSSTVGNSTKKDGTFTSAGRIQQQVVTPKSNSSTGNIPEGVYLLTVFPSMRFEGLAPMRSSVSGVSSGISNAPGCGSKWEVEGVQFKVIRLDSSNLSGLFKGVKDITLDDQGNLRQNLLAHWCYGTLTVRDFGIHPFGFPDPYNPLDPSATAIPDLTADDLPLAVFHWDGSQITFVDAWSARRRVIHPDATAGTNSSLQAGTWKAVMDDQRVAANQARFRQFQDQLDGIVASGNRPGSGIDLTKVKVTDFFTFLPPVGFLPVMQESLQTLLCDLVEKPHERGKEKETHKWEAGFHLTVSEPQLRMLGVFAGAAAGAFVGTVFLPGALLGATGGILAGLTGGIGSLLRLGSPAATAATAATAAIVAQEATRQQPGGQTGGQTPGSSQQFTLDASLHGKSEEEEGTETVSLRARFHERLCVTISQPRIKPDGTERSKTEGFGLETFFDSYLLRISLIGKDRVDLLMNESWYEDAIDLRPDRHPDPPVQHLGQPTYPVDKGLQRMPLVFDIYLVEENMMDISQPLYVLFHKALHPAEVIRFYKAQKKAPQELLPEEQTPTEEILPTPQVPTEDIFPADRQAGPGSII